MEVIANTEYQDYYRVCDGVLLVINKFESKYPNEPHIWVWNEKVKSYNTKCQKELKVVQSDFTYECWDSGNKIIIPKGTVLYFGKPVISTTDKSKWDYQIKTTGSMFSGDYDTILSLLDDIKLYIAES